MPAYARDRIIIISRVFRGSTDVTGLEDLIAQLLQHCGSWPEPESVLDIDNASFHHIELVGQICEEAGGNVVYLPPYSPELNPIGEFFTEFKSFIKRGQSFYKEDPNQGFDAYLK